jgi:hypothetical protein
LLTEKRALTVARPCRQLFSIPEQRLAPTLDKIEHWFYVCCMITHPCEGSIPGKIMERYELPIQTNLWYSLTFARMDSQT